MILGAEQMNLLFITQTYSAESTILGVTGDWVEALSKRVHSLHILAQKTGRQNPDVPSNVTIHSLGKELGKTYTSQILHFVATLGRTLLAKQKSQRINAILVHMVPRYAILAAPLAKLFDVPLVMWYAQGGTSRDLRMANHLVDRVVSASPLSYPLDPGRLVVIGHGIATRRYVPSSKRQDHSVPLLLSVGRLSPAKDHETAIEALSILQSTSGGSNHPILRICGSPLQPRDKLYEQHLRRRVDELGLRQSVEFAGNVPYLSMPAEYGRATVLTHTSRTASLDKVALEAMACEIPVATCNPAVQQELKAWGKRLCFQTGDSASLANRVQEILSWTEGERRATAASLRHLVVKRHGLEQWGDRVVALLGMLQRFG